MQESVETFEEETPNKVKKVELEIQSDKEDSSTGTNSDVGMSLLFSNYSSMSLLVRISTFVYFFKPYNFYANRDKFANFRIP